MFEKLVAIEPVSLIPSAVEKLHIYAKEVIMYDNMPENDIEVAKRIGNADAVFQYVNPLADAHYQTHIMFNQKNA